VSNKEESNTTKNKKMAGLDTALSVTLNVNSLNSLVKKQRLRDLIKKTRHKHLLTIEKCISLAKTNTGLK
jgi:hypothetical protein